MSEDTIIAIVGPSLSARKLMAALAIAQTSCHHFSEPRGDVFYTQGLARRKSFQSKEEHYTVDSPEVKRMSKAK